MPPFEQPVIRTTFFVEDIVDDDEDGGKQPVSLWIHLGLEVVCRAPDSANVKPASHI